MSNFAVGDCRRWVTDSRYYRAIVQQDLFGCWELLKAWGGLGSRLGRHQVCPATSREQAFELLEAEERRRVSRGYRPGPL